MSEPNLSLRLKGDRLVLKLGTETKTLAVSTGFQDDVTELVRVLLARRLEIQTKQRREQLIQYTTLNMGH